jgi:GxxExxY protein
VFHASLKNDGRARDLVRSDITGQIIAAAFEVHGILGYGFHESADQRAMQEELRRRGPRADTECPITVVDKGPEVEHSSANRLVGGVVIVELKVVRESQPTDEPQLLTELIPTQAKVGMPINFGRFKVQHKRMVF